MKSHRPPAVIAAALTVVLCAVTTGAASGEFTVVEKETFQDGTALDISCGERHVKTYALPERAVNVEVLKPRPGQVITDGFGRDPLATVESVILREQPAPEIEVTVVGGYKTCEYPGEWRTNGYEVTADYERILHTRVVLSEEPGGLNARQEPKAITATYDAGWKALRWRGWGDATTTAKGKFYARRAVALGPNDARLKRFTYPVEVKLSKIRLCSGGYYYTRMQTRFLRRPHPDIGRQAHPPSGASCLDDG